MIRSATALDATAIVPLTRQLGYSADESSTQERLAFLIDSLDHEILVYEDDGLIAWASLYVSHSLTSEPYVELIGLVVDSDHRSRGIGAKMMVAAEEWARSRGFSKLRLRTNLIRADAHRFYERIGYKAVKEQRVYEKELG